MYRILKSFAIIALLTGLALCVSGCGHGSGQVSSNVQSSGKAGNAGNSGSSGNSGNSGNVTQPFTFTKATTVKLPGSARTAISDPVTGHAYVSAQWKDAKGNLTGAVVAIDEAT